MKQKKICLLGAFSVGKTSLIAQFVSSMFDEKYLTTVGVKVDKKVMAVGKEDLQLMIWDLAGEDDYSELQTNYLRGSAGYILVADGTRPRSLETMRSINFKAKSTLGNKPHVLALNKADLTDQWALGDDVISEVTDEFKTFLTSAKTGQNVEELFRTLAEDML